MGLPLSRGARPLRRPGRSRRAGRAVGRPAGAGRGAREDRQRPALDGVGPEHGPGRDPPARPAARQLDHAGQGEPGDPRGRHPGRARRCIGNDAAVAFAGSQGNFELNVYLPVIARNLLESIRLLASVTPAVRRPVRGRHRGRRRAAAAPTPRPRPRRPPPSTRSSATSAVAELVKESAATGKSIRTLVLEQGLVPEDELDEVARPAPPHPGGQRVTSDRFHHWGEPMGLPERWICDRKPSERFPLYTRGQRGRGVPVAGHAGHLDPRGRPGRGARLARRPRALRRLPARRVLPDRQRGDRVLRRVLLPQRGGQRGCSGVRTPGLTPEQMDYSFWGEMPGVPPYVGGRWRRGPGAHRGHPGHARLDLRQPRAHGPRGRPGEDGRPAGGPARLRRRCPTRRSSPGTAGSSPRCGACSPSTCSSPTAPPCRSV